MYRLSRILLLPLLAACAPNQPFGPVTMNRAADTIDVFREGRAAVFLITSPSGIGDARFDDLPKALPSQIILRFRYSPERGFAAPPEGLYAETNHVRAEFNFSELPAVVNLSYPPCEGKGFRAAQKAVVQCKVTGRFFECQLPEELTAESMRYLRVSWVDFYRQ